MTIGNEQWITNDLLQWQEHDMPQWIPVVDTPLYIYVAEDGVYFWNSLTKDYYFVSLEVIYRMSSKQQDYLFIGQNISNIFRTN